MTTKAASARRTFRLLQIAFGSRAQLWLMASVVCAPLLAGTEFMIAAATDLLLRSLGLSAGSTPFLASLESLSPTMIGALFCIVGIVRGLCMYVGSYAACYVESAFLIRLRQVALHQLLLDQRRGFLSPTTINFRFGELFVKASQCASSLALLIPYTLLCLGLLFFMMVIDSSTTMVSALGIAVIGGVMLFLQNVSGKIAKQQLPLLQDVVGKIQRISANRLLIRVLRTEHRELRDLGRLNSSGLAITLRSRSWSIMLATLPPVFGLFLLTGIIGIYAQRNDGSGLKFVLFLYLLSRLVQVLGIIASFLANIAPNLPHLQRALDAFAETPEDERIEALRLIDRHDEAVAPTPLGARTPTPTRLAPEVRLSHVDFAYDADTPIIQDLTLTAGRGQQLGIVGVSGSGKTTVLAMIVGILKPTRGSVAIDGMPVEDFLSQPGSVVGYVGAEPYLFEGTIKENLDYGANFIPTEDDYARACDVANFAAVLARLPQGLNHLLTGDGFGLSAGEKQRLALARALLRQPSLLILDEFTANVDSRSEQEITESLRRLQGSCTCIIVSHRPAVFKHAAAIHDLSSGRQVSYDDLIRRAG